MNEKFPSSESSENIYQRGKFERERAPEYVEQIATDFSEHYSDSGYLEREAVPISSKTDPTVRFIGSHISVFKPELLGGTIPAQGEYMVQDCLRTKNVRGLFDDSYVAGWGSSFTSLGALVPKDRLNEATERQLKFFTERLKVNVDDLRMRVSSADKDLLDSCLDYLPEKSLEIDTREARYYQHVIGIEGVRGRNYNMALRNPNGEGFSDVGNIILLENDYGVLGIETAIGSSVVLKQLYNLEHVNDCYPLVGFEAVNPQFRRKLEDSIIVSMRLLKEGLLPRGSDNRERILRSYLRSILYFALKTNISLDSIHSVMENYEATQFPNDQLNTSEQIITALTEYEADLRAGKVNGKEDEVIAAELK